MALCKALLIAATSMAIVMGALLPSTAWAKNHVVGEDDGWNLGVDYEESEISVGDTLEFIYDPTSHNVVMVDENSYNRCNVPVETPYTWNGGDNILHFEVSGKYFFICGMGDHCTRGMKLAVTVI